LLKFLPMTPISLSKPLAAPARKPLFSSIQKA